MEPSIETYPTQDGGAIEGAYFAADGERVVLLCHGSVFNKESWYPLARQLHASGIASFAIDFRGYGNSKAPDRVRLDLDVTGAVDWLKSRGFRKIGIVGGSMGGMAVLTALASATSPEVDRVAILSAHGSPLASDRLQKLFVVSKDESSFDRIRQTWEKSALPRHFKVFPGSAHAQHLFAGPDGPELTALLIQFFKSANLDDFMIGD